MLANYVCKLNKVIYGLKQAPKAWNNILNEALTSWGFKNARSHISLFILRNGSALVLLLVYVDDVIVTRNDTTLINKLIKVLDNWFALKDLGTLNHFLGVHIHYLESGVILNQEKYADDLLNKLGLNDLKVAPSPSVMNRQLSLNDGLPMEDPFVYRSTMHCNT